MTHYRAPGSVEDTLKDALNDLTPKEIKDATGKGQSNFYKISLPGSGSDLDFDDAAAIDAALIRKGLPPRFLPLLQDMTRAVLARLGNVEAPTLDLDAALRRLSIEAGELAKATDEAMQAGTLNRDRRREIAREAQDVIDGAKAIRNFVEPPYEGATADPIPLRTVREAAE